MKHAVIVIPIRGNRAMTVILDGNLRFCSSMDHESMKDAYKHAAGCRKRIRAMGQEVHWRLGQS